jgi:hypothetical protein
MRNELTKEKGRNAQKMMNYEWRWKWER